MKIKTKEWYNLMVIGSGVTSHFQFAAKEESECIALTDSEHRKLYIVIGENENASSEVWYVGEAYSSMKERFQRSFASYRRKMRTNMARGGYQGYKWIEPAQKLNKLLKVYVLTFEIPGESKSNSKTIKQHNRSIVEAIEGELVYLVRNETGDWPRYQNEIHFYHSEQDKMEVNAKESARLIWAEIQHMFSNQL